MPPRLGSVDPLRFPSEIFDLYSIPAYDLGVPETLSGNEIGSNKQLVQRGDVLFSRIVPHIRRAWIVGETNGHRTIGSGEWIVLRSPDLLPDYLRHFLLTDDCNRQVMRTLAGVGGSLMRARPAGVAQILIPVPPLEEQKRIGAILDKADDIRRKREQAIQLADEFLRSLFLDMFGDPVRNPNGWPVVRLEKLLSTTRAGTRCGPFGSSLKKEDYVPSGIPVWGIDNVFPNRFQCKPTLFISERKFKELQAFNTAQGDILISRAGTVGRMCVIDQPSSPSIIGTNLIRLSLNQELLRPEYFTAVFSFFAGQLTGLRANAKSDAYSFMNTGVLKTLCIQVPEYRTQLDFVSKQSHIRSLEAKLHELQGETACLTHSLTKRVFRTES